MDRLIVEYSELTPRYERRWAAYLDALLNLTLSQIPTTAAGPVLDVACGTGRLLQMLAANGKHQKLVGIDRVTAMLDVARQKSTVHAEWLEADAEKLPLQDGLFGLVSRLLWDESLESNPTVDVVPV